MKNKGFTLVELLAVISILAILVLISIPNIIDMYNNARKRSFLNEVETVKTELKKETFNSSLKGQKIPEVYSSFGENQLDMDGRELEYYAEMNSDGSIKYLEICSMTSCIRLPISNVDTSYSLFSLKFNMYFE